MLRERTLGNSSTRLAKQLRENHSEEWLQRLARYMELCNEFASRPTLFPVVCQRPPEPVAVPTSRWLMTVYGKDLMSRMGHIKASITSTFGSILKMDSTKKVKRTSITMQQQCMKCISQLVSHLSYSHKCVNVYLMCIFCVNAYFICLFLDVLSCIYFVVFCFVLILITIIVLKAMQICLFCFNSR